MRKLIIMLLFISSINLNLFAVEIDSALALPKTNSYYYEPYPMKSGDWLWQLGASATLLPVPVTENEIIVPSVDLQFKMGLSKRFSLVSSLYTNVFSNVLHGGIQWNKNYGNFSIGLVGHLGVFFGWMDLDEVYEINTAYAFIGLPMIRTGYRFEDFSLTSTIGASFIIYGNSKISEINTVGIATKNPHDLFLTLTFEQPFLRRTLMSFGFSVFFDNSPYQCWLLYNTLDYKMFIPEFFIRFQL